MMLHRASLIAVLVMVALNAFGAPVINSISPDFGSTTGGNYLVIRGSGFDTVADVTVTFGNAEASDVEVRTDRELRCVSPAGDLGTTVDMTVSQSDGSATLEDAYTYVEPVLVLSADNAVWVSEGSATITINSVNTETPSVVALSFTLSYDPDVFVPVDLDQYYPGVQVSTKGPVASNPDTDVRSEVTEDGRVEIIVASTSPRILLGDGKLCFLHFALTDEASPGDDTELTITRFSAANGMAEPLTVGGTSQNARLIQMLSADVNGDGGVNVADVQLVANAALGIGGEWDTDINDDGSLNAIDIQLVINSAISIDIGDGYQAVSPAVGPVDGGTVVRVLGNGFTAETALLFGEMEADVEIISADALIARVPVSAAVGEVDVLYQNAGGVAEYAGAFTYAEPDGTVVSASTVPGAPGTQVAVGINLASDAGLASAVQFDLAYDPSVLTPVDDMDESRSGQQIATPGQAAIDANKNVSSNVIETGMVRVMVAGWNQTAIGDGELCQLHFSVAGDASEEIEVEVSGVMMSDTVGTLSIGTGASGLVEMDIDGDGLLNREEDILGTDPTDPDSDDDGLNDGDEDADGDGVTNYQEFQIDTDPNDPSDPPESVFVSVSEGSDTQGSGTQLSPWATIRHTMAAVTAYSQFRTVSIYAGAGTYVEQVVFVPNVHLIGAGIDATIIQHYEGEDPEHFVVTAADNTRIENCTVTVPGYPRDNFALISIDDVAMTVENCRLNGQLVPGSIGVFVSGWNSSDTAILNNDIERLEYGVYAIDTEANIGQNNYTSITGVGLFVSEPAGKSYADGQVLVPIFGSADTLGSAGLNCFRNFLGTWYIQNASQTPVIAQFNDWGAYDMEEISDKMAGLVEFEPFVGIGSADASGVIVAVLDTETELPVSASRQPTALLDELSLAGTADPNTGMLVIQDVPSGTWTVTARANGYMPASADIEVVENRTTTAILYVESYSGRADVNGTDDVNAVDVQLVINAVLGIDIGLDCDIDDNDSVNAVDVQLVINAALGL